ncbi:bifunctional serine/threonine-protein kinase/ABC transporter substrate-binding protein [Leptolyngbya sp. NIES-2104]|uniref:bifunctional serine/threonine-protein kinase/ABC transporter substrate-binding protein n=1 Tax=Leptolyngbya sp. NIES-2104 TaxID=1552121 RepID=UPI0006EC62F7|nr:bifunctional serine/threonine-protein kinase/ABC transporter substrate-binding protein [Leptolyngbya sp. NIES-2104]GAP95581.1 serine/threonine protein kinase [Leptolyngbya sp. NIES-2104]
MEEHEHPYTEVFEVADLDEGGKRKVLKTLKIHNNSIIRQAFGQERRILSELRHPSIPRLEDAFSIAITNPVSREIPCLVMQWIEGENLEDWLDRGQRLTNETTEIDWFAQLARVLDYVHQRQFFHRDIKPSNIIRQPSGRLVLIDFGTARELTETVINGHSVTQWRSLGYTAPEQLLGKAVPQSDVYALGRTLLHLLTGTRPDYLDVPYWYTMLDFTPSERFRNLLDRCLDEAPQQRPTTRAILAELQPSSNSGTTTLPPLTIPSSQPKQWKLSKYAKWIALGLIALIVAIAIPFCQSQFASVSPQKSEATQTKLISPDRLISYGQLTEIADDQVSPLRLAFQTRKDSGIEQLSQGNFAEAVKIFDAIREDYRNPKRQLSKDEREQAKQAFKDPQILIYRNNAESRRRSLAEKTPLYTIAVATPLNLEDTDVSRQILFGAAQMQDRAVRDKLNLEIMIANDRGNTEQAKAIAQSLVKGVDQRSVLAIVGHYTSAVTCAVLGTYSEANIVVVSSASTAKNIRNDANCNDRNKVFFRTTSTTEDEAVALLGAFQRQNPNGKKIGIFYSDEKFSQSLAEQFKDLLRSARLDFVEKNLSENGFDVARSLSEMKDVDAIALFADGQTNSSTTFRRSVEILRQNQGKKLVLAANTLYNSSILGEMKKLADRIGFDQLDGKMIVAADWFFELPGASAFREELNSYWAGDFNHKAALSYEAVQVLTKVFQSPNFKLSPNAIRDRLNDPDFIVNSDILRGRTISFDPDTGDRRERKRVALKMTRSGDQFIFDSL